MNVDWECLAFGKSELPPLRKVGIDRRFRSAAAYLRACSIYRRRGFAEASRYLCYLKRCSRPLEIASPEEAVRLARRHIVFLRIIGRFAREDILCLPSSVSLTAGLIALGLPAQLIVGKARQYISPNFDFHAWTEINGVPINDVVQTQNHFYNLLRYPNWDPLTKTKGGEKIKTKGGEKIKTKGGEKIMTTDKQIADEKSEVTEKTKRLAYEKPLIEVIGRMEELTGSGGSNNDDGWQWSKNP